MTKKIKTREQIEKFTEMWNSNIPRIEIAREFGIQYTYIYVVARQLGLSSHRIRERFLKHVPKYNELIESIKEKGVCSHEYLNTLYCNSSLSSMLRELIRSEQISMFDLHIGGGSSPQIKAYTLFDGIRAKNYYYINEETASNFIIDTLQLGLDTPQRERQAMTIHLKRCLTPSLFHLVRIRTREKEFKRNVFSVK